MGLLTTAALVARRSRSPGDRHPPPADPRRRGGGDRCAGDGRVGSTSVRVGWLAGLGVAFLVVVVGWWAFLLLGLTLAAHLAVGSPRRRAGAVVITPPGRRSRSASRSGPSWSVACWATGSSSRSAWSYLVFQLIAYIVDVRRGRIEPADGPVTLFAFALLPPIRMSGPVLRYR